MQRLLAREELDAHLLVAALYHGLARGHGLEDLNKDGDQVSDRNTLEIQWHSQKCKAAVAVPANSN